MNNKIPRHIYQELARPVLEAIRQARKHISLPPQRALILVVGVSGGEDSIVLFDVLHRYQSRFNLELIVAHINHGLRPESDEEELFVQDLAQSYACRYFSWRAPEQPPRLNQEAWARDLRYRFFGDTLTQTHAHYLVTAHHQNDQAETILGRFLSGRAQSKTGGIQALDLSRHILRPLSDVPKRAITDYRLHFQLAFRDDSSNNNENYQRNWLRHTLLPLIGARLNPSIVPVLCGLAARYSEDEAYLWDEANKYLSAEAKVTTLPQALAWRVLFLKAQQQLGERALALSRTSLTQCLDHAQNQPTRRTLIELEDGITCRYDACLGVGEEWQFMTAPTPPALQTKQAPVKIVINQPIVWPLTAHNMHLSAALFDTDAPLNLLTKKSEASEAEMIAYFDADRLPIADLLLRQRISGDRMNVYSRGMRKIKKLMQEHKVPLADRTKLPILVTGETALWIPGVARSDAALITAKTRHVLAIKAFFQPR